ncbi:hypothetical protein JCM8547_001311 [Rhodosporidiobolus lusitaniae]
MHRLPPPMPHRAQYMNAPASPSTSTLASGRNPFRDSSTSLASTARAKYTFENSLYAAAPYDDDDDDLLHKADPKAFETKKGGSRYIVDTGDRGGLSFQGLLSLAAVIGLALAIVMLFAGWPILNWAETTFAGNVSVSYYEDGAIVDNAPNITNRMSVNDGLIDPDTPTSAYTKEGVNGQTLQLVFSDEFETDGRLFYPGMDPFFEAVDLHYWQTADMEWYEPDQAYTKDGFLWLQLTKENNASSHSLGYLGGMIQSWNKFCFTGGRIEVKLSLPGDTSATGLWPAVWTMGNLGRAGFGASLEGMWPYNYDICDIGTLANQTDPTTGEPVIAEGEGDEYHDNSLSYLTGQRLSACTCKGEDHPGPWLSDDKRYRGRAAPEIDVFEALLDTATGNGNVSQSLQVAPFNLAYELTSMSSAATEVYKASGYSSSHNSYLGGVYQQVASGLSYVDDACYNTTDADSMSTFGFEYTPTYLNGYGTGEVTWLQQEKKMWMINDMAIAADEDAGISNRTVTGEPLYIIMNLGMSSSFQTVDIADLTFPAYMRVDYVRIYQDPDNINIGCDPELYPTAEYIEKHKEAYTNPNLTTWADYSDTTPKNSLIDTC